MSRATDGARPWSESAAQVGPRHMSLPPISLLIDAPRQSNSHLHTSSFAAIIATVATPDSHPDCRALLIKIVALHGPLNVCSGRLDYFKGLPPGRTARCLFRAREQPRGGRPNHRPPDERGRPHSVSY